VHTSHLLCCPSRRALTLAELLVVIAIIALVSGFVLPSLKRGFDRLQTRAAAQATLQAFFTARAGAIAQGRRTTVLLDRTRARVLVVSAGDTLLARAVGSEHGVTMIASRDSMTFFPDGLGLGGANLSVVLVRGRAADTVIVSREGRAKLGTRAR
jgi:prepilin-type N-terminal cleavage/methylation domain-containing protein